MRMCESPRIKKSSKSASSTMLSPADIDRIKKAISEATSVDDIERLGMSLIKLISIIQYRIGPR